MYCASGLCRPKPSKRDMTSSSQEQPFAPLACNPPVRCPPGMFCLHGFCRFKVFDNDLTQVCNNASQCKRDWECVNHLCFPPDPRIPPPYDQPIDVNQNDEHTAVDSKWSRNDDSNIELAYFSVPGQFVPLDTQCRRQCQDSSTCCGTDQCENGVCVIPDKWRPCSSGACINPSKERRDNQIDLELAYASLPQEFVPLDKRCRRQCRDRSNCCHTDQCGNGVCMGPGKWPRDNQVDLELAYASMPEHLVPLDKRCRRQCRDRSNCCHTDQCGNGVCMGPGKWPRDNQVIDLELAYASVPEHLVPLDKRCRRQCRDRSNCCHTDQCGNGVCMGPGKWPRDNQDIEFVYASVPQDFVPLDKRCRRQCRDRSNCCHTDQCGNGVCMGPGKWP